MTFELESTVPVLGTPVAMTRYDDAVQLILQCAGSADRPYLVAAADTHLITLACRNREYASTLEKFDFIVADGMPLIWYLNFFEKADLIDRVYGPELMTRCLAASGSEQRHFFLGASDATRQRLQEVLKQRFPALTIVGGYSPPFGDWDDAEDAKICRAIREKRSSARVGRARVPAAGGVPGSNEGSIALGSLSGCRGGVSLLYTAASVVATVSGSQFSICLGRLARSSKAEALGFRVPGFGFRDRTPWGRGPS